MSVASQVDSDGQLARLLQIGIVLEEVVEARAYEHYQRLPDDERDERIEELLREAREESADHRERLKAIVDRLDIDEDAAIDITPLVREQYAQTGPEDFDGILYDQLNGEETAYKFYDDLIEAIERSETSFSIDRESLLSTLRDIRETEAEGAEAVAELMESRT
ncbi:ferritin-like domain-containing protein [Halarchaeum nitratireducens]|uniref:Rubrerythrin n=1 Tax=Halarchaeum nitratireducens TaxID=489913 RepID=A0A830GC76_9EURY|nr:ferritin-like domain-containing protein [Halarchaeum nitratireducens]MBP2252224.1 ferritin-like protein [Halarchaeum solikamskense]GGN18192.1 rubrerythrin [Halarchaeum nitratireducens]